MYNEVAALILLMYRIGYTIVDNLILDKNGFHLIIAKSDTEKVYINSVCENGRQLTFYLDEKPQISHTLKFIKNQNLDKVIAQCLADYELKQSSVKGCSF